MAAVLLIIAVPIVAGVMGPASGTEERPIFRVRKGPLVISVTESGTLKNREEVEIKSQVDGRNEILMLAPEGSNVKKGDLLVELDASGLTEQLAAQELKVINAESSFVRARENHAVVKSQGESDVAQAELDLRFAKLDLEKYEQGEYPQQLKQADSDITLADEALQRATQKLEWSKKLHAKRYLSTVELQADEAALMDARIKLELSQDRKRVLEKYSHPRDLAALRSDITQATNKLERVRRKASADLVQAESELRTRQQELNRQKREQKRIEDQISKCKIHAPVAGMVVYATTGGGWRSREEPIEEGVEVRRRQHILSLPTASSMMAEINVHESNLKKVRPGLPVHITVDAAPGKIFKGTSAKIAHMPDSQSAWLNPDLKVYDLDVHLDGTSGDLRPGMSCRAEIFVDRYDSTLYVPVQCVVRVGGEPTVYVKTADGLEARQVEIGLDNNRMVRIVKGLSEGEPVVLDPPLGEGNAIKEPEVPEVEIPKAPPQGQRPQGQRPQGRGQRPQGRQRPTGQQPTGNQPPNRRG
ncbi:MAG: efflux RND transporter periplasmic adaptor subunit [Planctomycetota bacterium]